MERNFKTWQGQRVTFMGEISIPTVKELGYGRILVYALAPGEYDLIDRYFSSRDLITGLTNFEVDPLYERCMSRDSQTEGEEETVYYGNLYCLGSLERNVYVYCVRLNYCAMDEYTVPRAVEVALYSIADRLDSTFCFAGVSQTTMTRYFQLKYPTKPLSREEAWPLINEGIATSDVEQNLRHYYREAIDDLEYEGRFVDLY